MRIGRLRSSKVIDFGTNRKRVCDFLLVRHSDLGPILHRFGDIAGFRAYNPTPYSTQFWVADLYVGVNPSMHLQLFSREIIFEVFQHLWYGRRATYCGIIIALCVALRGKNNLLTFMSKQIVNCSRRIKVKVVELKRLEFLTELHLLFWWYSLCKNRFSVNLHEL